MTWFYSPLYPITIGTLLEYTVLSISTASLAAGFDVVVATEVVEVTVGVTSSHSNESHGHPPGQFSLIIFMNRNHNLQTVNNSLEIIGQIMNNKRCSKPHMDSRPFVFWIVQRKPLRNRHCLRSCRCSGLKTYHWRPSIYSSLHFPWHPEIQLLNMVIYGPKSVNV